MMQRRRLLLRWAAPLLAVFLFARVDARQTSQPFTVNFLPSAIYPGDVVRVEVPGIDTFDVGVFGKHTKDGLVGIDLEVAPGTYPIRVEAPDGRVAMRSLRVLPKAFAVRRLQVAPGFVNPTPEEVDRIAKELHKTEGIFHTTTLRKWSGAFQLPVAGTPTSNFGTRSYYNGQRRSPHTGVDFVGQTGTPVHAANNGVVVLAEPLYFTGNTVIVDYGGGLYSLFAHLSEIDVKIGATVAPDTVVGLVGATGRVTGPHLHWSVRLQGARVDPLSLAAATKPQTR
ncbi:MAG: M23 family metallopeptidase [Vicinamibacterales bacterium]|nr:M23 family metallopeptidase [Vicinamibacterales bacterium]